MTQRTFETGATRDDNADKLDFQGFLSPTALRRFAEYMHQHRKQADGSMRAADNWKQGIPIPAYLESFFRHVNEFQTHVENDAFEDADEIACALLFNVQGYLHEREKVKAAASFIIDVAAPFCSCFTSSLVKTHAGMCCGKCGRGVLDITRGQADGAADE